MFFDINLTKKGSSLLAKCPNCHLGRVTNSRLKLEKGD